MAAPEGPADMEGGVDRSWGMAELAPSVAPIPPGSPGGGEGWAGLIARFDHAVVLSLLARGLRLDRARELAQETWALLFERWRHGRLQQLELPGLAITQAGYLAADLLRQEGRAGVPLDEAPELADVPDPGADAERQCAGRQELARAVAALARCSARARHIFLFVYENPEVPHRELARRLGISVQRLRQSLCEVRARIRRGVQEDGHG